MGILYEVREDGEYDEQENAAKSSGLCCLVTVFGVNDPPEINELISIEMLEDVPYEMLFR